MQNDHQLRLLYLYQILLRDTDADHPLSTQELLDRMENTYHIKLHRTTIPQYIKLLNASGFEVMEIRSREKKYYLDDRLFELPEIKLLMDAVQASRFISPNKSQQLLAKLTKLTSEPNAEKLKRNLYVTGRVKSDNEKSYYIVEAINNAINAGKQISFYYTDYNARKERVLKNDGKPYVVSPYALIWDGDFYYPLPLFAQAERKNHVLRSCGMWYENLKTAHGTWQNATAAGGQAEHLYAVREVPKRTG